MDRQYLAPVDLLTIAAQHAFCAEHLLKQNAEIPVANELTIDALLPITTLIHMAFELTLKAYLLHQDGLLRHHKNLSELVELNAYLGLSRHETQLIATLSRQFGFRKGTDNLLWENRQQLQVFCEQMLALYVRVQDMMPVELQGDYQ